LKDVELYLLDDMLRLEELSDLDLLVVIGIPPLDILS